MKKSGLDTVTSKRKLLSKLTSVNPECDHILSAIILFITVLLAAPAASAITIGTYTLANHPAGNKAPPLYGLRLDGLLGYQYYTFDFDDASSDMTLTWNGTKIVIDGHAYGGGFDDASYHAYLSGSTAVWDIHFEYTVGISQPGDTGLDDLYVHIPADNKNFGTLNSSLTPDIIGLADHIGEDLDLTLTFQFGDGTDGLGHRGQPGISGWGWPNHGANCTTATAIATTTGTGTGDCSYTPFSGWLFTASPVPVPAAVWLFASGLLGLVAFARRM